MITASDFRRRAAYARFEFFSTVKFLFAVYLSNVWAANEQKMLFYELPLLRRLPLSLAIPQLKINSTICF